MAREHAVHDHRGHCVVDSPVVGEYLLQRLRPAEPLESRPTAPHSGYLEIAAITQVEADRNPGLGQRRPDRIMEGVAQRPRLDDTGHRRRSYQYQLGAAGPDKLHLVESL